MQSDASNTVSSVSPTYPRPVGTVPMLTPLSMAQVPDGPDIEPGNPDAEVIHSDQTRQRVTVLAWRRIGTGWAAVIRWPNGVEDWRKHDPRNVRPR
jgi:hypothetical protein